jgi:hypothetical protein
LQATLTLATDQDVFLESDGRFYPYNQNGLAVMEIRVDGGLVSDGSTLDYKNNADPQQHSYNCIGATHLSAGTHTVALVAYNHPSVSGGQFYVGAGSNLSVVVDPAVSTSHAWLNADSPTVNVSTLGVNPPTAVPYLNAVSTSHLVYADPVVVMTSGRGIAGNPGTSGGMPIYGGVVQGGSTAICSPSTYQAAPPGANNFWSAPLTVQPGESGNVFFTVKTRLLDCNAYEGPGTISLQLVLDGVGVGSVGLQQYDYNNTCHQRTITASYLALGLAQGPHSISAVLNNVGSMPSLAFGGDMGLLFFGS